MLQLHATSKAKLALGVHISKGWTWKATNRLSPSPQCSIPLATSNDVDSELLGDVRPFALVFPHTIQPVKTDPPPIQHSRHNP